MGDSSLVCANPCYSSRAREKGAVLLILPFSLPFLSLFLTPFLPQSHYCLFSVVPIPFLLIVLCHGSFIGSKQTNIALISRRVSLTTKREWSVYPISSTFNAFCRRTSKIEDTCPGGRFLRRSIGVETGQIYTKRTSTWAGYYGCATRLTDSVFFATTNDKSSSAKLDEVLVKR